MTTRSASSPATGPRGPGGEPPGPRSWIWSRQRRSSVRLWHQSSTVPTSVTRAARRTATRSAFALRPTRIRLCNGGKAPDRVGVGGDEVAGPVVGADGAARQREGDGLTHQQVEIAVVDLDLVPFLRVARDDAEPGPVGPIGLEPDVVRTAPSAADPDAAPPPDDPVIRRAVSHGQVERGVRQDARGVGRAGVVGEPRGDDLDDPVADDVRRQGAAVEEDRVGPRGAVVGRVRIGPDRLGPVSAQEGAEVLRDRRVGHERQAELLQAELRPPAGSSARGTVGKNPSSTTSATSARVNSD